jgi:hypothetical protein
MYSFSGLFFAGLGLAFWGFLTLVIHQQYRAAVSECGPWFRYICAGQVFLALLFLITLRGGPGAFLVGDAVEYSLAAKNLVRSGSYSLPFSPIQSLPPRFPIWFSLLFLSPWYALNPESIVIGYGAVIASFLFLAILACSLGCLLGGNKGGLLTFPALLIIPGVRYFSQSIITEIPVAMLTVLLVLLFLQISQRQNVRRLIETGIILAVFCALRVTHICMVVPFAVWVMRLPLTFSRRFFRLLLLFVPLILIFLIDSIYNFITFGSPLFNGYHFWVPVPYQDFFLTFSARFIQNSAYSTLIESGALPTVLLLGFLVQNHRQGFIDLTPATINRLKSLGVLFAFGMVPLLAIYSAYFYASIRFSLPIVVALGVSCGGVLGGIIPQRFSAALSALPIIVTLAVIESNSQRVTKITEISRIIRDSCTPNTTLVTAHNPLLVNHLVRGSCKRVLPLDRSIEYASKATLGHYGSEIYPSEDTRSYARRQGGQDVYVETLAEISHLTEDTLLDITGLSESKIRELSARFALERTDNPLVMSLTERYRGDEQSLATNEILKSPERGTSSTHVAN